MTTSTSVNNGGGISFCGVLAIVFIILKLCDVIQWSWLWVLAPLWIPFILFFIILILICVCSLIFKW